MNDPRACSTSFLRVRSVVMISALATWMTRGMTPYTVVSFSCSERKPPLYLSRFLKPIASFSARRFSIQQEPSQRRDLGTDANTWCGGIRCSAANDDMKRSDMLDDRIRLEGMPRASAERNRKACDDGRGPTEERDRSKRRRCIGDSGTMCNPAVRIGSHRRRVRVDIQDNGVPCTHRAFRVPNCKVSTARNTPP